MADLVFSRRFTAGEEIFRMGGSARNADIIERGKVQVSAIRDGQKVVIAELGKGEIFGEMSMIDDTPRPVTVIEDAEVIVMRRSRF